MAKKAEVQIPSTTSDQLPSLYNEIVDAAEIERSLLASGGELTPVLEAKIDELARNIETKGELIFLVHERLEASEESLKKIADMYYGAASSLKKARERLKIQVKELMKATNRDKIEVGSVVFTLQRTKPALIVDEKLLPKHFMVEEIVKTVYPDNEAIRRQLELGEEIIGARLEESKAFKMKPRK